MGVCLPAGPPPAGGPVRVMWTGGGRGRTTGAPSPTADEAIKTSFRKTSISEALLGEVRLTGTCGVGGSPRQLAFWNVRGQKGQREQEARIKSPRLWLMDSQRRRSSSSRCSTRAISRCRRPETNPRRRSRSPPLRAARAGRDPRCTGGCLARRCSEPGLRRTEREDRKLVR